MTRILIAGYQHETNTFAPSLADWAAFNTGENFPAFVRGQAMQAQLTGINIPVGGFIDAAKREAPPEYREQVKRYYEELVK